MNNNIYAYSSAEAEFQNYPPPPYSMTDTSFSRNRRRNLSGLTNFAPHTQQVRFNTTSNLDCYSSNINPSNQFQHNTYIDESIYYKKRPENLRISSNLGRSQSLHRRKYNPLHNSQTFVQRRGYRAPNTDVRTHEGTNLRLSRLNSRSLQQIADDNHSPSSILKARLRRTLPQPPYCYVCEVPFYQNLSPKCSESKPYKVHYGSSMAISKRLSPGSGRPSPTVSRRAHFGNRRYPDSVNEISGGSLRLPKRNKNKSVEPSSNFRREDSGSYKCSNCNTLNDVRSGLKQDRRQRGGNTGVNFESHGRKLGGSPGSSSGSDISPKLQSISRNLNHRFVDGVRAESATRSTGSAYSGGGGSATSGYNSKASTPVSSRRHPPIRAKIMPGYVEANPQKAIKIAATRFPVASPETTENEGDVMTSSVNGKLPGYNMDDDEYFERGGEKFIRSQSVRYPSRRRPQQHDPSWDAKVATNTDNKQKHSWGGNELPKLNNKVEKDVTMCWNANEFLSNTNKVEQNIPKLEPAKQIVSQKMPSVVAAVPAAAAAAACSQQEKDTVYPKGLWGNQFVAKQEVQNIPKDDDMERCRVFATKKGNVIDRGESFRKKNVLSDPNNGVSPAVVSLPVPKAPCGSATSVKVMVAGSGGVGKSALIGQFLTSNYVSPFAQMQNEAISKENKVSILLDEAEYCMLFTEFSLESDDHDAFLKSLTNFDVCILMYCVDSCQSFLDVDSACREIADEPPSSCVFVVVGNKIDLERRRKVKFEEGASSAKAASSGFAEISVDLNHRVDELLIGLIAQVKQKKEKTPATPSSTEKQDDPVYGRISRSTVPQAKVTASPKKQASPCLTSRLKTPTRSIERRPNTAYGKAGEIVVGGSSQGGKWKRVSQAVTAFSKSPSTPRKANTKGQTEQKTNLQSNPNPNQASAAAASSTKVAAMPTQPDTEIEYTDLDDAQYAQPKIQGSKANFALLLKKKQRQGLFYVGKLLGMKKEDGENTSTV